MKNMKRLVSFALALAMVLGLSACGKTGGQTGSGEDEKITLTIGVPSAANVTEWENNAYTLWLEEQSGYNIDIVNFNVDSSEWKTQLITMAAGGEDLPDIFVDANAMPREFKDDGYLVDLAPYFKDENNEDAQEYLAMLKRNLEPAMFDRVMGEAYDGEGRWFGFPMVAANDTIYEMLYINKVWLDKLGLEMPKTWDDFVNVLTAFKDQDPNGNGIADEIPMMGAAGFARSNTPNWIINNFTHYHMSHTVQPGADGKLEFVYLRDGFREGLKAGRDLYDRGLLSDLTWTIKSNSELPATYTPVNGVARCGIITGYPTVTCTRDSEILYEYVPLEPLEGSFAGVHPATHLFQNYIFDECEHKDEAFRLLCIMASPESTIVHRFGKEGVDWEWATDYEDGHRGVHVINNEAMTGTTDTTWGRASVGTSFPYDPAVDEGVKDYCHTDAGKAEIAPPSEADKWSLYATEIATEVNEIWLDYAKEVNPEEYVLRYSLAYTAEEDEKQGSARSDIYYFVNQMIAEFMTGERDIYDDKEWNNFCDRIVGELNGAAFLEVSQAAYERYKANVAAMQ